MKKEEIKKELNEVNSQIKELTHKRRDLEQKLINTASSFPEAFKSWYESSDACHLGFIIQSKNFPILRQIIEDHESLVGWGTVHLEGLIEMELYTILEGKTEQVVKDFEEYSKNDKFPDWDTWYKHAEACCREAMDGNMKSFDFDW